MFEKTAFDALAHFGLNKYAWFWTNHSRPKWIRHRAEGACYMNATLLNWRLGGTHVYCEGFAPYHQHAWIVDPLGRVVDSTWKYHPKRCYFGMPFRNSWMCEMMATKLRAAGLFWQCAVAELKRGESIETILHVEALAQFDAQTARVAADGEPSSQTWSCSPSTVRRYHREAILT